VLEKYFNINAEMLLEKHGIHPCKDLKNRIECSTGSLGQGITVAVGKAIADKNRRVFVLCSDGEAAEGSYMESCKFLEENPSYSENIKIFVNYNGFGAYKTTDKKSLEEMFPRLIDRKVLNIIDTTEVMNYYSDTLKDLAAHYKVLTKKESEKYV
jgi:transketolase N-terminal domain/subunit